MKSAQTILQHIQSRHESKTHPAGVGNSFESGTREMSTPAVSLHESEGISSRAAELLADTTENPLSNISIVELLSRYEDHGLHISQKAVETAQGKPTCGGPASCFAGTIVFGKHVSEVEEAPACNTSFSHAFRQQHR